MKRELEREERKIEKIYKGTYSYQLLGSRVDSKRRQGQDAWSPHGHLMVTLLNLRASVALPPGGTSSHLATQELG